MLAAAAAVAVYQLAFFAAVADTGVAVGTIVALGSAPTLTGLFEWLLDRRRPEPRWTVATALACAGVALLALVRRRGAASRRPGSRSRSSPGGSYAAYTLAAKRLLTAGHAPEAVMAVAFGLGAVVLLPALVLSGRGWLLQADGIALALYLGVVPTALAYVLFARGLRAAQRLGDRDAHARRAADRGRARRDRAGRAADAPSAAGAGLVLSGLVVLGLRLPAPVVASARAPRHDPLMAAPRPLHRTSTVDALADALRREILDGELAPASGCASTSCATPTASRATRCERRCGRWRPRGWCGSSRTAARASRS